MKHVLFLKFITLFMIVLPVQADPIQDLSMQQYVTGWYPNFYHGTGPLTCAKTCDAWVDAVPESEKTNELITDFEQTSVCKVTRDPEVVEKPINSPSSHWLYGNQFDTKTLCYVGTSYGEKWFDHYMCLCVCDKPDLIVSKIYDPIWDHFTGRSIIKADITNIGKSNAMASFARMIDPDTMDNDVQFTPALPAGATATIAFYLNYWVFDPNASLEVTADYKLDIRECNEANNVLTYFKEG